MLLSCGCCCGAFVVVFCAGNVVVVLGWCERYTSSICPAFDNCKHHSYILYYLPYMIYSIQYTLY